MSIPRGEESRMSRAINPLTGKKRNGGKMWKKVRGIVLERDAAYHGGINTCEYCGGTEGEEVRVFLKSYGEEVERTLTITVDHVVPFTKGGGEFDLDNLISCCSICNAVWNNHDKPQHILKAILEVARERNRAIGEEGGEE
jgi:5-methylcytosine-specific restriction endonuclease McrA